MLQCTFECLKNFSLCCNQIFLDVDFVCWSAWGVNFGLCPCKSCSMRCDGHVTSFSMSQQYVVYGCCTIFSPDVLVISAHVVAPATKLKVVAGRIRSGNWFVSIKLIDWCCCSVRSIQKGLSISARAFSLQDSQQLMTLKACVATSTLAMFLQVSVPLFLATLVYFTFVYRFRFALYKWNDAKWSLP